MIPSRWDESDPLLIWLPAVGGTVEDEVDLTRLEGTKDVETCRSKELCGFDGGADCGCDKCED